ncbi:hypothetical protein ACFVRT_15925 [Arthrobacter koreensis]|uniref:hypothetical protein n=1 Tax=Arthrobacter koreensis TaxID=199136 RepID=UPI0036D7C9D6
MSTRLGSHPGTFSAPAGGQFAPTDHPEAEGVTLVLPEPSAVCDECGDDTEPDGKCMNCQCGECGKSLNDGEGWDGLCGNCADAKEGESQQIFDMSLTDADGDPVDFSVNRLDDGHYEVEDENGDAVLEFYLNGDEEDHLSIQEAAVEELNKAGHKVSE